MDISEVLSLLKFFVPLLASWLLFRVAKRIRAWWLRLLVRMLSSAVIVVSLALVLLVSVASVACSRRAHPIYSPDQRHVAILTYALQGALGDDYAKVAVRSRWIPWSSDAYRGLGAWDFKNSRPWSPEVRWLDSAHLLIRYADNRTGSEGRGGPAVCQKQIGAVHIVCERMTSNPE